MLLGPPLALYFPLNKFIFSHFIFFVGYLAPPSSPRGWYVFVEPEWFFSQMGLLRHEKIGAETNHCCKKNIAYSNFWRGSKFSAVLSQQSIVFKNEYWKQSGQILFLSLKRFHSKETTSFWSKFLVWDEKPRIDVDAARNTTRWRPLVFKLVYNPIVISRGKCFLTRKNFVRLIIFATCLLWENRICTKV